MKITDLGISFEDVYAFDKKLKHEVGELVKLEDAGDQAVAHELGLEIATTVVSRHPVEVGGLLISTMADLVRAEAKIKDLEASLASVVLPTEIPAGPVADQINHFLAHPESGVRRVRPDRRSAMIGVQVGKGNTQINTFNESGNYNFNAPLEDGDA